MESILSFPLKSFLFPSYQVHKATKIRKTTKRSFKKIVPKVFRRRAKFSVVISFPFIMPETCKQDKYRTPEPSVSLSQCIR